MTTSIPMIDLLHHIYIESRKNRDFKAISDIDSKIKKIFSDEWDNLTFKQQWLLHKYTHSIHVFETGLNIILSEKKLKSQPIKIKKDWYNALLMHDIGRADEVNTFGKRILKYSHGTRGIEILKRNGIKSPYVLFPVLMHDKLDFNIFELKPEDVMTNPHFLNIPNKTKATIKALLKQYHQMNKKEQEAVQLGCKIVVDADQLTNLKEFDKMLNLSKLPIVPKISGKVEQAVREKHYVDYQHLRTYPDEAVAYMAWMFYGNFSFFKSELTKKDLPNNICQFVLKRIVQNNSEKDVKALGEKLKELQNIIEKNLSTKIYPDKTENNIDELKAQKT